MDKSEFLNSLSKQTGISYDEARLFYDKFIQRFLKVLKSGQNVRISGFGDFEGKMRKAKRVFDPETGLKRTIPSRVVVSFSPTKSFLEKVNIKYNNLKPVVVKAQPSIVEEKDLGEFNLTFFGLDRKQEEPVAEKVKIFKPEDGEDYFALPDAHKVIEKFEDINVNVPVSDVFQDVGTIKEDKEMYKGEIKINFGEVKMPEFNLTEEPQQPQEKKEPKKIFDDTQRFDDPRKKEEPSTPFEYDEESGKRAGFWIFLFAIFLIFVAVVVFLLNRYGYIHLWDKDKKASKVEFRQPEKVIETTPSPELKPKAETPVEEKKIQTVTPAPKPKKPVISKSFLRKSYVIQVASFQDKKMADALANNLKKKGYNVFVERAFLEWKGGSWYRVRVGFFDSIEQANEVARRLKKDAKVKEIWVSEAVKGETK